MKGKPGEHRWREVHSIRECLRGQAAAETHKAGKASRFVAVVTGHHSAVSGEWERIIEKITFLGYNTQDG